MRAQRFARYVVATSLVLANAAFASTADTLLPQRIVNDGPPPNATACEREDYAAGLEPVPYREQRPPKKVRDVRPTYPELPPGTQVSGMWIGQVRLDVHGKVSKAWVLRPVRLSPPFPAFNEAILDAVRQWQFEPFVVRGKARPYCMTISVTVDPR